MPASSISLEEKVEALTISYQTVTQPNSKMAQRLKEMTQQNEYLRKSLKQKQQILESPSCSVPDEVNEEAESQHSEFEVEEPRRTLRRE